MDGYTISQWLLFFFVYCLIGWIWETCFTSIKQRKFVNRGFLYGPILPIYGFGAIIILLLTLPVKENFLLIFLFGMIGATALEFVTGAAMERIFHMRYWDYSKQPLNVNGYICFKCSLGWGFFSIILVKGVHEPLEKLLLAIPDKFAQILSIVLIAAFAIDVTRSVTAAFNLKEILTHMAQINEKIVRAKSMIAEFSSSAKAYEEKEMLELKASLKQLEVNFLAIKEKEHKKVDSILHRNPSATTARHKEALAGILRLFKNGNKRV